MGSKVRQFGYKVKQPTLIEWEYIKSAYVYDAEGGKFCNKRTGLHLGSKTRKGKNIRMSLTTKEYGATSFDAWRVAFLMHYGKWPFKPLVTPKDGNHKNLRLDNWVDLDNLSEHCEEMCQHEFICPKIKNTLPPVIESEFKYKSYWVLR